MDAPDFAPVTAVSLLFEPVKNEITDFVFLAERNLTLGNRIELPSGARGSARPGRGMNLLHNKRNPEERLIGLILWKGGERRLLHGTSPRRTSLVRSLHVKCHLVRPE